VRQADQCLEKWQLEGACDTYAVRHLEDEWNNLISSRFGMGVKDSQLSRRNMSITYI